MATLRNTFAWSRSRDGRFRECLRAYWFTYYGAWGGWRADASDRTRTLYRLKNLRSRPMWAGDVVHRCIERALGNVRRGIEPLGPEAAIEATIGSMRDEWRRSRAGAAKERLAEHEYAIPVPDAEWQATADHVRHCLWSFYGSAAWETLRRLPPERWLEIEELSSFDLEGTKVWVKLDAAWRGDDGRVILADWKTGRSGEDDHSMQVATYVLYAARTWDVPADEVEVLLSNLATGTSRRIRLSERALDAALSRIRTSIRDMRQLLADPASNEAREEDFPPVDRPRTCRRCAFRRVCVEEGIVAPLDRARDGSL